MNIFPQLWCIIFLVKLWIISQFLNVTHYWCTYSVFFREKKNCSQFNATKEGPKKKYLQLFSLISFKKNDNVIFLYFTTHFNLWFSNGKSNTLYIVDLPGNVHDFQSVADWIGNFLHHQLKLRMMILITVSRRFEFWCLLHYWQCQLVFENQKLSDDN